MRGASPTLARLAAPALLSPGEKLALSLEILVTYARARSALQSSDVRAAAARARRPVSRRQARPPVEPQAAYVAGTRLGWAVTRLLDRLPTDSRCLVTSLVLSGAMARRGVECPVVIGVRPGEAFGAHAWVELDGRPLIPDNESEFDRLVTV